MFELASPYWLLALPLSLLPLWAWWRPHTLRLPGIAGAAQSFSVARALSWLPAGLAALGMLCTTIALARPQRLQTETVRDTLGLDILLAIDTSGSMRAQDMGRGLAPLSRLDAAKIVMVEFVQARQEDRLGLLVFGEEAFVQVPPTLDSSSLGEFINALELGMAGGNATAVGDAIAVGVKRLKDLDAPSKLLIVVTDGKSNAGVVQPIDAAKAAKALGVKIYTVGIGSSQIDEQGLSAVAALTGGRYYPAPTLSDLDKVYADIDKNEKTTAKVREYVHRDELYHPWLHAGLVLWLGGWLLGQTVLRRLP